MSDDPEIAAIAKFLEGREIAKAAGLDAKAWRRLMNYAISMCSQEETVAADKEKAERLAARATAREAAGPIDRSAQPGWHVLGHRRSRRNLSPSP